MTWIGARRTPAAHASPPTPLPASISPQSQKVLSVSLHSCNLHVCVHIVKLSATMLEAGAMPPLNECTMQCMGHLLDLYLKKGVGSLAHGWQTCTMKARTP